MTDDTYLGDGLYASYNGFRFKLRAPRGSIDHVVYLDPDTLHAFVAFIGRHGWKPDPQPNLGNPDDRDLLHDD